MKPIVVWAAKCWKEEAATNSIDQADNLKLSSKFSLMLKSLLQFEESHEKKWNQAEAQANSEQFTALRDPKSLCKELTSIFSSMKSAGLYPIFVLDEMDKLEAHYSETRPDSSSNKDASSSENKGHGKINSEKPNPQKSKPATPGNNTKEIESAQDWFKRLTIHLKSFLQEHVLFCFVADRELFQHFVDFQKREQYATTYSIYEFAPLVVLDPKELDTYVSEVRKSNRVTLNLGEECELTKEFNKKLLLFRLSASSAGDRQAIGALGKRLCFWKKPAKQS